MAQRATPVPEGAAGILDPNRSDELPEPGERQPSKLEFAACAAWLYHMACNHDMAGNPRDQIARKLSVSRTAAQRLVAAAASDGLIKFRSTSTAAT
jgi:DNA-binding transcriptional regulator LsrR (DeoR family)